MNAADDALLKVLTDHLRAIETILLNPAWHADETAQSHVRESWAAFHGALSRHGRPILPATLRPLLERAGTLLEQTRTKVLSEGIDEAKKMLDRSAATRAESTYLHAQQTMSTPSRIDFKG